MRKAGVSFALLAGAAIVAAAQVRPLQGIDALISAAADATVKILPAGKRVLAVSWFTFEGSPAGISDTLTAGLVRSRHKINASTSLEKCVYCGRDNRSEYSIPFPAIGLDA
jgi:hypothetical protein